LGNKICGEILHAVIAEVTVKLAVERKLLIVEGWTASASLDDRRKGIATHLGDGLLTICRSSCEGDAAET